MTVAFDWRSHFHGLAREPSTEWWWRIWQVTGWAAPAMPSFEQLSGGRGQAAQLCAGTQCRMGCRQDLVYQALVYGT